MLAVIAVDLLLFWDRGRSSPSAWQAAAIPAAEVAVATALVWRRRFPLPVFALVWLYAVLAPLFPGFYPTAATLVALYTVAAYLPGTRTVLAVPAAFVTHIPVILQEARTGEDVGYDLVVVVPAVIYGLIDVGVWGLGRWIRGNRVRMVDLDRRRQEEAREAIARERSRIAQELHDIVSHAVTVMVLQAAGARRIARTDLARTEQALDAIEGLGTQAMNELRRMLTLLYAEQPEDEEGVHPAHADRGLAHLDELLDGIRQLGVSASLRQEGEPVRLDRSVDLAAYRVVQEALVNVTKHVGTEARVTVLLRWADGLLVVEVCDDGPGPGRLAVPAPVLSTGHGLLGLGERVAVVGGRLETRQAPGGGFQVTARFPVVIPHAF